MILPTLYGNVYSQRLTEFYKTVYHKRFGEFPSWEGINMRHYYWMLKRVFTNYGEIYVAAAILMHFEQDGERIIKEKFPIMWLEKSIPKYIQQLKDKHEVNIDNEAEVYQAIKNRLKYLAIDLEM